MEFLSQKAAQLLVENIYCSLGTSSLDGCPWISPVYYSINEKVNIFWASSVNSKHSLLLVENPRAFISIYDSASPPRQANGLYLSGFAQEIIDSSINDIVIRHFDRVNEQSNFTGKDFSANAPEHIYRFNPDKIWILDHPKIVQGHPIDQKIEVPIIDLQQKLATISETQSNKCFQPTDFGSS